MNSYLKFVFLPCVALFLYNVGLCSHAAAAEIREPHCEQYHDDDTREDQRAQNPSAVYVPSSKTCLVVQYSGKTCQDGGHYAIITNSNRSQIANLISEKLGPVAGPHKFVWGYRLGDDKSLGLRHNAQNKLVWKLANGKSVPAGDAALGKSGLKSNCPVFTHGHADVQDDYITDDAEHIGGCQNLYSLCQYPPEWRKPHCEQFHDPRTLKDHKAQNPSAVYVPSSRTCLVVEYAGTSCNNAVGGHFAIITNSNRSEIASIISKKLGPIEGKQAGIWGYRLGNDKNLGLRHNTQNRLVWVLSNGQGSIPAADAALGTGGLKSNCPVFTHGHKDGDKRVQNDYITDDAEHIGGCQNLFSLCQYPPEWRADAPQGKRVKVHHST